LGLLYRSQGRLQEAIQAFERLVALNPQDGSAHFNLAVVYAQSGTRFRDALRHYDLSKTLGHEGDPVMGTLLEPFLDKEQFIDYAPQLASNSQSVKLYLTGNAHAGKDAVLLRDALQNLEIMSQVSQRGMFRDVHVELLELRPDGRLELWTVKGPDFEEAFSIDFKPSPDGSTDFFIAMEPATRQE